MEPLQRQIWDNIWNGVDDHLETTVGGAIHNNVWRKLGLIVWSNRTVKSEISVQALRLARELRRGGGT